MPVVGSATSQNYPTLETILSLIRSLANDAFAGNTNTPGEGQVLTDLYQTSTSYNPQLLNCFNSAIRELYRKLRNVKFKGLVRDNYILEGLPPVDGPLGVSQPDPTIQTYLTWGYYFDGTNQNTSFVLPSDLIMPLQLWERQSNTTDPFVGMREAGDGLNPSSQTDQLRHWEWREDKIWFLGALIARDIRIRYQAFLPQFFPTNPVPSNYFTTTQIPVFDCEEAVAWLTLRNLTYGMNPAALAVAQQNADSALFDLKNENVRRMQAIDYARREWDDYDAGNGMEEFGG